MLDLFVALIILVLVLWAVQLLIGAARIPQPLGTLIMVLAILFAAVWLANRAGLLP